MELSTHLDILYNNAMNNFNNYVEMIYIQAKSKSSKEVTKVINAELIEDYLKKRGYIMNYVLGKRIMVKNFTCVFIHESYIEVWCDKVNNKSIFIKESLLTGLPITLDYMERI